MARSSNCAIHHNVISDKSGVYKPYGIELAEGCNNVFTDNLVDDGARIGISVSGNQPKEYIFWGYNTIQYDSTWGAQIQGDSAGARCHYFYKNKFQHTYANTDSNKGHGFRLNGNCHYIFLDENEIKNNGGAGIQPGGKNIDQLSFTNNIITGNAGVSVIKNPDIDSSKDLEWLNNIVIKNGKNIQLSSRGFKNQKPTAYFSSITTATVGQEITFTNTSSDPDGSIDHVLWDFNDGLPSTKMNPTHVYKKPGMYRVTLLVWDNEGRGARAENYIIIEKKKTLIWFNPLNFQAPSGSTLRIAKGETDHSIRITSPRHGKLQWINLGLTLPSNIEIQQIVVYYKVSDSINSYINRISLTETTYPVVTVDKHIDDTDLTSTAATVYYSDVRDLQPNGSITLKLDFSNAYDEIQIGGIGVLVEEFR